jgi:hypothetical protein
MRVISSHAWVVGNSSESLSIYEYFKAYPAYDLCLRMGGDGCRNTLVSVFKKWQESSSLVKSPSSLIRIALTVIVDLSSLSAQQLSQVKKQLDEEVEHLTNSFTKLRAAQAQFRECLKSIKSGVSSQNAGTKHVNNVENVKHSG